MSPNPAHSRILYSPPQEPPPLPRWRRRHRSHSLSSTRKQRRSHLVLAKTRIVKLHRWAQKRVDKMSLVQKVLGSVFLVFSATMGVLGLVFHTRILRAMLPFSEELRNMKFGWMFIFALCYASAFPPMIGYSTSVTLSGFIYGFPNGWFIISAATILGATSAFAACRYLFRDFAHRTVTTNKRFAALSQTLKHDGLKLLCMVRLCPLPYSISNGALSTFPTVSTWKFGLATAAATPKLLIHVFIGARLALLAEADQKMDPKTRTLNYASIFGGIALGAGTGWLIYKRTMKRARQLEVEDRKAKIAAAATASSATAENSVGETAFLDLDDDEEEEGGGGGGDLVVGGDGYNDEIDEEEEEEDDSDSDCSDGDDRLRVGDEDESGLLIGDDEREFCMEDATATATATAATNTTTTTKTEVGSSGGSNLFSLA